jgi:hypothetical protein
VATQEMDEPGVEEESKGEQPSAALEEFPNLTIE